MRETRMPSLVIELRGQRLNGFRNVLSFAYCRRQLPMEAALFHASVPHFFLAKPLPKVPESRTISEVYVDLTRR